MRRALTQATEAERQAREGEMQTVNRQTLTVRAREEAFAQGARAAIRWAIEDTDIDAFGGVRIHERAPYFYDRTEAPT